jgi:hypothetical protein
MQIFGAHLFPGYVYLFSPLLFLSGARGASRAEIELEVARRGRGRSVEGKIDGSMDNLIMSLGVICIAYAVG